MDEKPKGLWKRHFTGRMALVIWLAVAVFTIMLGGFIISLLDYNRSVSGLPLAVGIFAGGFLAVCLVLIYVVWPLLRWLFWKHWRRTFFALACLVTLIALFYAEEDWRGKHDWEKFKQKWEAKGEKFDWQSIVPPSVPDDQNFAFSPVWIAEEKYEFQNTPKRAEAWYGDRIYSDEVAKIFPLLPVSTSTVVGTNMWRFPQPPDNSGTWASGQFLDLKPLQSYYRNVGETNPAAEILIAPQPQTPAQDVLLALSKFDPVIEQLRQDSTRPDSRFPLSYNTQPPAAILLPHLAALKQFAQVLQLRALAELQNGESEKALADVKLSLRLADSVHTEPDLIAHLVCIAILNFTLQPIWEGLAEHKWSDKQLVALGSKLAKLDFLADYEFAVRGERGFEIANIEFLRHPDLQNLHWKRPRLFFLAPFFSTAQMISDLSGPSGNSQTGFQMLILGLGPSGWLDQNELRIARFDTKWYLPIADEETKTISPDKVRAADNALDQEIRHRTPENLLMMFFIPSSGGGAKKFAYAQSSTDLARVAIALERYRLKHGYFPESLNALAPKFIAQIPHDIINGRPLHYRRTNDGQFVLYSVGWNERDDGGVVETIDKRNPVVDINQGDWVWRYPQK